MKNIIKYKTIRASHIANYKRVKADKTLRKENVQRVIDYLQQQAALDSFSQLLNTPTAIKYRHADIDNMTAEQAEAVLSAAMRERENIETYQKRRREWRKKESVDSKGITRKWNSQAKQSKEVVMERAVKALSLVEGLTKANDTFALGLDMPNVQLNVKAATQIADKLFTIGFAVHAVKQFNFDPQLNDQILSRIIAREFPVQDNFSKDRKIEAEIIRELRGIKEQRGHETMPSYNPAYNRNKE